MSKLEHMGKETVKKLQDIRGAAAQAGVEVNVPDNCILKGALPILVRVMPPSRGPPAMRAPPPATC